MTRAQLTAAQYATRHSRIAHLLRTTCRYCHAPAGEPCRSKSGTPIWEIAQMHNARLTRWGPAVAAVDAAGPDPDKAFAAH
jgi:hypothetical protein